MALGLSRMQPRSARPPSAPPAESAVNPVQEQDWIAQRGAILFEATCDLVGGFPGFADLGGEIADATARISDRFLIVDEGKSHGFGIPITWLDGALLAPQPDRDDPELRVFFSDGASTRCFSIRFRPNRLAMRGGKRAERAQDALLAAGLTSAAPMQLPEFSLPWDETREFDGEHVLWVGHASAPVQVGQELAPSEIWLSAQSLIWGSSDGNGLNRVPVSQLSDVTAARLKDRSGTPAVYLAVSSDEFGRYEIPFVFDQQETPDRNFRERGAFLTGLQSHAILEGVTTPLWQPWRIDVHPASRRVEAELFETVPVVDADMVEPAEAPGVRARLESWLPKLHAFANRGLSLPTVEDDKATVVAFPAPAFAGAADDGFAGPELDSLALPDNGQDTLEIDGFAEAVVLAEPETTFVLTLPVHDIEHAHSGHPEPEAADRFADANLHSHPEITVVSAAPIGVEVAPPDVAQAVDPSGSPLDEGSEQATAALDLDALDEGSGELTGAVELDAPAFHLEEAVEEAEGAAGVDVEDHAIPTQEEDVIPVPVSAAQRFETAALGVVADALQMIDIRLETGSLEPLSRTHSLRAERDAAFAEIRALNAGKVIKKREMRRQIERLTNLHDAGIRLRSVVDLYDRGRLNNPELERVRTKLVANVVLTPLVVPLAVAGGETARRNETFFGV